MNKFYKISSIICFICVIILTAYLFRLHQDLQKNEEKLSELKDQFVEYVKNTDAALMKNTESINSLQQKPEDGSLYVDYKFEILELLKEHINYIVDAKPFHNGNWTVSHATFISPTFIEVSYEDGHNVSSSLIQVTFTDNTFRFEEIR